MASQTVARIVTVLVLVACAVLGGYGTLGAGFLNGFFDSLTKSKTTYLSGGHASYPVHYTGITAVDNQLAGLIGFFAVIIDEPQSWDIRLSYWYLMVHFCAGMYLLTLEGFRKGNRGRLASW